MFFSFCFPTYKEPSENRSILANELTYKGNILTAFRTDSFQNDCINDSDRVSSPESVSILPSLPCLLVLYIDPVFANSVDLNQLASSEAS